MTLPGSINWDDLRIFLAVSRTGLLSGAAARLRLDETTVSRRIQRLEQDLGVQLFERSRQGHRLTPAGHELEAYAENVESAALSAQERLTGGDRALSGRVRVNVAEGFGAFFVAPRLVRFTRTHPGIDVELVASSSFLSTSTREIDIAVHLARPSTGQLVVRKLTDYVLRLYASPTYLAAQHPIRSEQDLKGLTLLGYIDDFIYAPELRYLESVIKSEKPRIKSSSLIAQFNATVAGAGLCILPAFMAHGRADLAVVLADQIVVKRSFWLIYPQDLHNVARVRRFADFLIDIVVTEQGLLMGTSGPTPTAQSSAAV